MHNFINLDSIIPELLLNIHQENDKDLLLRLSNGDRQAFSSLYTKYLDGLYRYVYLFTRSTEETEEIVQEVFIRIWESRTRLTHIESFEKYLFKAAKNKVIDIVRQHRVQHRIITELQNRNTTSVVVEEDGIDYREYYRLVQKAIEKLPPKRRQILSLSLDDGLSQGEIAEQLQISKSVVQKQLYKAFDFIREYLSRKSGVSFHARLGAIFILFN